MGEVLKKFGRYFLLDHIAQGGMAEIYRARLASIDGAGRLIVIKRIQAGYGENAEFLQMFKSEIKVTMGFNHPNIVQLYDFGEEAGQPYIAMELVDGKNLRQFNSRFAEIKQTFPVELAAFITEQAASGLHYAHSFKDKITGNPLNVVHRDISPQNILISYEGNVKVIDFGIAKATTNSEATRAGVIKGKPSYLSPEQISGETLDGRSDIFALGAVLWELLTGKKLFSGENDLAVLKLIESCQTHVKPPSTLNPKIPKELDYIVLKTLSKNRDKRYQNAEELQRALHKFLYSFAPEFNPSDLAYYAKDLFKNEIVEDRKRILKLNDKVEMLLSASVFSSSDPDRTESKKDSDDAPTVIDHRRASSSGGREAFNLQSIKDAKVEIEAAPNAPAPRSSSQTRSRATSNQANSKNPNQRQTSTRPSRPTQTQQTHQQNSAPQRHESSNSESYSGLARPIFIGISALLIVSVFGPDFGVRVPILSDLASEWTAGNEARLMLEGNQKNVNISVNGQTVANALPATLTGIPVGTPFRIMVTGQGGVFQQELTLKKGEKKSIPVQLVSDRGLAHGAGGSSIAPDKAILLKLNLSPGGGNPTISINGKPVDPNQLSQYVSMDDTLELSIDRPGYKPFKSEFVLQSSQMNGLKEWMMDIQLEPIRFGFLTIHTTPSANATIMLDGTPWVKKTPIENEKFPIGIYNIRLSNDVLGMEKNVSVSIQEGKAVNIDERLEIKN